MPMYPKTGKNENYETIISKKAMANSSYRRSVSVENIQKTRRTVLCVLGHLSLDAMGAAVVDLRETWIIPRVKNK